jgi:hypothetical protein
MSLVLGLSFLVGFSLGTFFKRDLINTYLSITIDTNNECPICYESVKDKHIIICNQCKKLFDVDCVTDWLCQSNGRTSCPNCRNKWLRKINQEHRLH